MALGNLMENVETELFHDVLLRVEQPKVLGLRDKTVQIQSLS